MYRRTCGKPNGEGVGKACEMVSGCISQTMQDVAAGETARSDQLKPIHRNP